MKDLMDLDSSELLGLYRAFIVFDCCDFGDKVTETYLAPWVAQAISLLAVEDEILDRLE